MGPGVVYFGTVMRGPETEASASAHVVEQILDRALPGWRTERPTKDKEHSWLRGQAARAKTALQREAELAEKLGGWMRLSAQGRSCGRDGQESAIEWLHGAIPSPHEASLSS